MMRFVSNRSELAKPFGLVVLVLVLASAPPAYGGCGGTASDGDSGSSIVAADSGGSAVPRESEPQSTPELEVNKPRSFMARHKGAVTLLAIESAGALLASSGYIAEAINREPKAGAEFTGGTYVSVGGVGAAFSFIWLLDPSLTNADRGATMVALAGLIALGAYDLSQAKGTPSSSRIFRDNAIGINVVVAATLATRWIKRRSSAH
jgi:ABC-type Fe3+-siderophore transport system permease subunit